jgi:hypothetical protein
VRLQLLAGVDAFVMAEIQSAYELTCSLREYNEQLEQARAAQRAARVCAARRSACANPTCAAARADARRGPAQVRELLAAEPDNEEYTDLQTSLLEVRPSRAPCARRRRHGGQSVDGR